MTSLPPAAPGVADLVWLFKCWEWSRAMRHNSQLYQLMPSEGALLGRLILDSFDRGQDFGTLDLVGWARLLGYRDSKGLRLKNLEKVLSSLRELGLVDLNEGEGRYRLRPDASSWSRVRMFQSDRNSQAQFKLCADRPLDGALTDLSLEKALASGPSLDNRVLQDPHPDRSALSISPWRRLQEALDDPGKLRELERELLTGRPSVPGAQPVNKSSEKSAETVVGEIRRNSAEKSADAQAPPNERVTLSSENSAETAVNKAQFSSLKRTELSTKSSEKSADEAWAWLTSVDRKGTLQRFESDYRELCEQHAGYVLSKLRWALEDHVRFYRTPGPGFKGRDYSPADPVGWMGSKAHRENKMRWRGRVR